MGDKLKSRKLWVAVLGAMLTALNAGLGSPIAADQVSSILNLLMVYLGGQAAVDAVTGLKS